MTLLECLRTRFGLSDFREGQAAVIDSILARRDVVTIMPTGSGKSLCYQLPALLMEGVTVVVSPLIALMKDQVDALAAYKIPATYINSTLSAREQSERIRAVRAGKFKLVYIAPERFRSQVFASGMKGLTVSLLAVDEAHCVSEWGHDFRPDYLRLRQACELLGRPPIAALTATATPAVREDIVRQLGLHSPNVFVAGFDRRNLFLEVRACATDQEKFEAMSEIMDGTPGSGLIYAATRKNVEKIAAALRASGSRAAAYHAGMDDASRHRVQDDFMANRTSIVAATNAFGMGIDKPDIRFVIHFDLPGSLEAYYQEIGRAGRDGETSRCALLFNFADRRTQEFFIEGNYPSREVIDEVYEHLCGLGSDEVEMSIREIAMGIHSTRNELAVGAALKILDQHRLIERGDSRANMALVRLLDRGNDAGEGPSNRDSLAPRRMSGSDPLAERVLASLLEDRVLETSSNLRVSLSDYAQRLLSTEEQIRHGLASLHQRGVIHYRPPFRGRATRILSRLPVSKLPIDYKAIDQRAVREIAKLDRMVRFGYHDGCLRAFILRYFGEAPQQPGCDFCANCQRAATRAGCSLTEDQVIVVKKVLSCVARMKGRYGKVRVAQVLKGSKAKAIEQFGLNRLSTYGLLAEYSQDQLVGLIEELARAGCLEVEGVEYPVVRLTAFGERVMKGMDVVMLAMPIVFGAAVEPTIGEPLRDLPQQPGRPVSDAELFERLRNLRLRLARRAGVPAFRIFSDRVLRAIVHARPFSLSAMSRIAGVGEWNLAQYGDTFLQEITRSLGKQPARDSSDRPPTARSSIRHGRTPTVSATLACLQSGMSLGQIAEKQGRSPSTISNHIVLLIEEGEAIRIEQLVSAECEREIREAIAKVGFQKLRPLKNLLPHTISYDQIRVVAAMARREEVNDG